jgi:hypothetical protein
MNQIRKHRIRWFPEDLAFDSSQAGRLWDIRILARTHNISMFMIRQIIHSLWNRYGFLRNGGVDSGGIEFSKGRRSAK